MSEHPVVLSLHETVSREGSYHCATAAECPALASVGPEARRARFLFVLRESGVVAEACPAVGASWSLMTKWRREDPRFAREYDEALRHGRSALLDVAVDRALYGAFKPVVDEMGQLVGWTREPSDAVLLALLKRMLPERSGSEAGT